MKTFRLARRHHWVFGVCAGLAYALDIPVFIVRLVWFIAIWFFGVGLGAYLILWIIVPSWTKDPDDMTH